MRVLVTGSAGFIGFHLTKRLLEQGHEVFSVDNLNDYYDQNLKHARLALFRTGHDSIFRSWILRAGVARPNCFGSVRPQRVIHLAAQAGVRYSLTNPTPMWTAIWWRL